MWLVFLLIFFTIVIFNSKFEIVIYEVNISDKKTIIKLKIFLKLLNFLKIFLLNVSKKDFDFLKNKYNKQISSFDIKLEKIDFNLKIWIINHLISSIAVAIISGVIPNIIRERIDWKNLNYSILPYNMSENAKTSIKIDLKGKVSFSMKSKELIKLYLKNKYFINWHNKEKNDKVKESF